MCLCSYEEFFNLVTAHKKFLEEYPNSKFSREARAELNEFIRMDWSVVSQIEDTIPEYEGFLKRHPESSFAQKAQARLDELYIARDLERECEALEDTDTVIAPDAFTIPLEIEATDRETKTRGDVKTVEGTSEMLLFSFDCACCQVEMPMSIGGSQPLIWASGAEHIYKGGSVAESHEVSMTATDSTIGDDGQMILVGKSGETFAVNRLQGWYIEGNPDDPLIFKVVQKRGYVHIGGTGLVRSPTGEIYQLGE
jgi:hypothetical protein